MQEQCQVVAYTPLGVWIVLVLVYLMSRELVGLVYTNSASSQWSRAVNLPTFQSLQQQQYVCALVCSSSLFFLSQTLGVLGDYLVIAGVLAANSAQVGLTPGLWFGMLSRYPKSPFHGSPRSWTRTMNPKSGSINKFLNRQLSLSLTFFYW
jgi:hypothetical protein